MLNENPHKNCKACGNIFYKGGNVSKKNWEKSSFCSLSCINKGRICPWRGKKLGWKVWNKGTKGLQTAWNKGLRYELNARHPLWKGNNASMIAQHQWIVRRLGKPQQCEMCGMNDPNRRYQWSNISREYKREVEDYQRLCIPCHKRYDLDLIKKEKKNGRK